MWDRRTANSPALRRMMPMVTRHYRRPRTNGAAGGTRSQGNAAPKPRPDDPARAGQ